MPCVKHDIPLMFISKISEKVSVPPRIIKRDFDTWGMAYK